MMNSVWRRLLLFLLTVGATAFPAKARSHDRITLLYDAFGREPGMRKDWGFAVLVEIGGKRVLFDTGNDAAVFEHNVKGKRVDLRSLDFVVLSHRHGDHIGGLTYLLSVNPQVPIYAPKENFGVFGSVLPGSVLRENKALPPNQRYFNGNPPATLKTGTAWPGANFRLITETSEVAPGVHLIMLRGSWGVDLDVMELSLAIDTPNGVVLIVGCSHPTIEKIVQAAQQVTGKQIHLIVGGTHLLPAKDDEIARIATVLHDKWRVEWIAPAHCTGEPAFAALKAQFGDHDLYAGVGTILDLTRLNHQAAPPAH